jgi:hypothetical protein
MVQPPTKLPLNMVVWMFGPFVGMEIADKLAERKDNRTRKVCDEHCVRHHGTTRSFQDLESPDRFMWVIPLVLVVSCC